MNTCRTCKHWDTDKFLGENAKNDCSRISDSQHTGKDEIADKLAVAWCVGDVAWLKTAPDFGCVLWEPKQ